PNSSLHIYTSCYLLFSTLLLAPHSIQSINNFDLFFRVSTGMAVLATRHIIHIQTRTKLRGAVKRGLHKSLLQTQ
ncbi:hypothetical protein VIGAN_01438800, partial [Vigna angularis var. angularis]